MTRPRAAAPRTVFVSGASSGIGRATALRLADEGWRVFAGVRRLRAAPIDNPGAPGSIQAVPLDVTDARSVAAASNLVKAELAGAPLTALINNAGVGVMAPMATVEAADLQAIWDVNVFGLVRLSQAMLPIMGRGSRLVVLGSVGDRLTMPFGGPLTSSKWAAASMAEAFRMELRERGIAVTIMEPGLIASDAPDKVEAHAVITARKVAVTEPRLAEQFRRAVKAAVASERKGSDPDIVAHAISRTLNRAHPKTRVLIGKGARPLATVAAILPDRVFDLIRIRIFIGPRPRPRPRPRPGR